MIQTQVTSLLAYEPYFVYLHLCIADSDCVIFENEFDVIRKAAFPNIDKERGDTIVKQVYYEFLTHSDTEKKETIKKLAAKFLRTTCIKDRVLESLKKFTNREDGCEEQLMYNYIEEVIGDDR